jgi:hypothetical protein
MIIRSAIATQARLYLDPWRIRLNFRRYLFRRASGTSGQSAIWHLVFLNCRVRVVMADLTPMF